MTDERPDPERLLKRAQEEARHENRGKLKIYLGAAPGVGKTHEMMHDALNERAKGLDVVAGVVETHSRQDIDLLLKNFEVLPRQIVKYHGKELLEFDIDAALKRSPGLILMDEMAHTNAPDLRHAKRWQDIKELLDRGINVYTTLNVQHIESLSDDAAQIIHAPIKETVPDSMIEMANTIELVDIPPEELLQRLQEGKVYIPEQAKLATEHFFRKGNLIALRELALRTTAERVGTEVLLYRQGEGIKYIWPSRDKILVCVGPEPESLKLIRAAKRIANSLQAMWMVVYIETPGLQLNENNRSAAIQYLRFAEQLGAQSRLLAGSDIVKEVMSFAHEQNVTQIMVWKHIRKRWQGWFHQSLADEVVRQSGEIDVYIMTGNQSDVVPKKKLLKKNPFSWMAYAAVTGIVALATVLNIFLYPYLAASNLIMVYLLGVTIVALMGKSGPSVYASILSVLAYDFFFIPPFYNLLNAGGEYFFTLLVMLLVTQLISHLTITIRRQAESARLAQHQTSALYTLSRQLANTRGIDKLLETGTQFIGSSFDSTVTALMPKKKRLEIAGKNKAFEVLDNKERGIAEWVYELGQAAGFGTDTLSFSKALYLPLLTSQGAIGVLRIEPRNSQLFTPEQIRVIEACTSQIASALAVDSLQETTSKLKMESEIDVVQSRLLQSISHDLRIPLISVIASASTLMEIGDTLEGKAILQMGKEIYRETEQLSRLINNLLQIGYLESKDVKLQINPSSLNDTINLVIKTSSKKLKDRPVRVDLNDSIPLIAFDNTLIQEVMLNLIDNAVKFTPPNSAIEMEATIGKEGVTVSIGDHGPGIMPDEVDLLFEKFYRGRKLTTERGLGLGLAICKTIIEAHGGKIWAENRRSGGSIFRFTLPLAK